MSEIFYKRFWSSNLNLHSLWLPIKADYSYYDVTKFFYSLLALFDNRISKSDIIFKNVLSLFYTLIV